ncbi:MAG: 3-deoxy-D-manno-octulosonic acid transferase, partial [Betaproteobacteria bacterium]
MLMRALYCAMWWIVIPFLPLRLWWRGRREPGYRAHVAERFGRYPAKGPRPRGEVLWVHAVSLGETRAATPLIERLRRDYPEATILLTHMTATGRESGHALHGDGVVQAWLPYDLPFAVDAFLDHFKPRAGMLMETEVWPNMVAACAKRQLPLLLVNARLSERSLRGYQRWSSLTQPMFAALGGVAAQTAADAARLTAAGARDVEVTGNLKFDIVVPDDTLALGRELRTRFGAARSVWLAASTRDGEEVPILDALLRNPLPDAALTVILPRHPQRFQGVADLLTARGIPFVRRSDNRDVPADVRVVLGDTLGEQLAYCAAADIVFMGGSLVPLGGHNLIEPIALGVPTLIGPHTFNFADATMRAVEAGAALRVADADALVEQV